MWQVKSVAPWAHKLAMRSLFLAGTTTLLVPLALVPSADAQLSITLGVGERPMPPVCSYGYYNYEPYGCAPSGYYGPGYFYNGVFLGVGPWSNWGYGHGWGGHRFNGGRGGMYRVGARGYYRQPTYAASNGRGRYSGYRGSNHEVHGNAPHGNHHPAARGRDSHGPAHGAPEHHGAQEHHSEPHGGDHHQ